MVPWAAPVQIVEPHYPRVKTARSPFGIETILRIYYLQYWFGLSCPSMEEALHNVPLYRQFTKLDSVMARVPDDTTILRFRHMRERHDLATDMVRVVNDILQAKGPLMRTDTAMDATLINTSSVTKNLEGERDLKMKQTKRSNQWRCGTKAHIGMDADFGLAGRCILGPSDFPVGHPERTLVAAEHVRGFTTLRSPPSRLVRVSIDVVCRPIDLDQPLPPCSPGRSLERRLTHWKV